MRLLLLGCSGFVGRELVPQLLKAGHQLTVVSRKPIASLEKSLPTADVDFVQIDPALPSSWEQGTLFDILKNVEGVVNLVGEPIAEKRWTSQHLAKLRFSRLSTTTALVAAMDKLRVPPKVLVNASAVGYYGTSADESFTESSKCGEDFLADLCRSWEAAAAAKPSRTRLLLIRIGIVLEADGGALGKMLPVFRAGFGGPLGNGRQWMSWIHRTDLCRLIGQGIEGRNWSGIVNAVAPETVFMMGFAKLLGQCLGRPSLLPVPAPILKVLLGDGARVVLEGQNVSSERLDRLGFKFQYPSLDFALKAITKK